LSVNHFENACERVKVLDAPQQDDRNWKPSDHRIDQQRLCSIVPDFATLKRWAKVQCALALAVQELPDRQYGFRRLELWHFRCHKTEQRMALAAHI
jgi:hypothetical protein